MSYGLMIEFFGIVRCLVKSKSSLRPNATCMLLAAHENTVSRFLVAHYGKRAGTFRYYVSSSIKEVHGTAMLKDCKELLAKIREDELNADRPSVSRKASKKAAVRRAGDQGPLEEAA